MKKFISKIALFVITCITVISCSVTKDLNKDDLILRSNEIFVNGSKVKTDSLSPLITQKKKQLYNRISFSWKITPIVKKK